MKVELIYDADCLPLVLGIVATSLVLAGKFGFDWDWFITAGVVLLVVAMFLGNRANRPRLLRAPHAARGERATCQMQV